MSILHTESGALGLVEAGTGGTPIVFLHGVGSDKSVWHPQLAHFASSRRAVAFDYPGYGESAPAQANASRDEYAAAIFAGMDSLGIGSAHICGLSLGGVIAIAMHSMAPDRCASLILADSFAVHPDGRAIYERSLAASGDLRAIANARVDALLAAGASDALRTEVIETMARIPSAAYVTGSEAVWLADQTDRARAINVPTLVLVGEEDRITPLKLSEELAALIPGARLETIPGAGHISNLERSATFNAHVDAFLGETEASPA